MDPPAGFRHRHALHPMDTALVFQPGISTLSGDNETHRFHTSDPDLFKAYRLHTPPASLRVVHIHTVDITGKERRLVTTRARTDLDDHILVIIGILGQEQDPEFFLQLGDLTAGCRQFLLGQRPHLFIALLFQKELRILHIPFRFFVGLICLHQGCEITLLFH